jgi:hypothetical protein
MSMTGLRSVWQRHRDDDRRPSLWLSRASLLVLAVVFGLLGALGVRIPLRAQMVVYLVGMIGLNLPHGGYEHFENLRRRRPAFRWRYVAV